MNFDDQFIAQDGKEVLENHVGWERTLICVVCGCLVEGEYYKSHQNVCPKGDNSNDDLKSEV